MQLVIPATAPAQVIRSRAEVGRVNGVPTPSASPPSSPSSGGLRFRPVKRARGAFYLAAAAAVAGGDPHTLLRAGSGTSQSFAFNQRQSE